MKQFRTDRSSQKGALETVTRNGSWTAGVIGVGSGKPRSEKVAAFKKVQAAARKRANATG